MTESNTDVLTAANDCFASENRPMSAKLLARLRRNRLSRSQFGLLVDYMTLNPELVMGKYSAMHECSKDVWNKKWEELADLLNADWTGAKRDAGRWRKAWHDQKMLLRRKVAKRDQCIAITGSDQVFQLTELEERVLKMINDAEGKSILYDKRKASNAEKTFPIHIPKNNTLSAQIIKNTSPQIISPSGYIVLGVGPDNIPVSLQHVNPSSSNMETANVLIGLEPKNIILSGLQQSSDILKKAEESIISVSAITCELNKSQNKSDKLNIKHVDSCSEKPTQVKDWREKDTSSLNHESQPSEAWADQKNMLRIKAARRDECRALTGDDHMFKLTELEERLLKVINDAKKRLILYNKKKALKYFEKADPSRSTKNINSLSIQPIHNVSPQIILPSGYIVLGVQADNTPVSLQHVNPSSANIETANVLIGLEPRNIILTGLQPSSDISKKVEQTIISVSAATTSELNKSPNKSDNEQNLKIVDSYSAMQTQLEDWKEKDTSSLIHESEPYEVSRTIENGITSDSDQSHKSSEKTENVMNSSSQNSSGSPCVKKRKLLHKSLLIRRNEFTVTKLLQKQNELLEGIAATLARIEQSVKERSSVEVQGKNKMLTNISENIETLAESLGTVSKSLKAVTDN